MDDTISRKAAIDRAVSIPMFGRDIKMVAVSEIENLPSAQPDVPDTNDGDMISRKAAIDVLDKRFDDVPMELTTEILQLRRDLRERIPSAKPEIIRCKDCKHRGEKPIADGRYWCDIHDDFMYYCSDAERRES